MKPYSAIAIVVTALSGCSQPDEESLRLAEDVQRCIERTGEGAPISVPVRIALADDGSVALIEVKGRNADQAMYDAQYAVMRAVERCAPYDIGRTGEFEVVVTY